MKHASIIAASLAIAGCLPSYDTITCERCFDAAGADAGTPDVAEPDGGSDAGPHVRARSLAAGLAEQHSCAILDDGTLQCWGDNTHGQLGLEVARALRPSTVLGLPPIDEAATGFLHTCARAGGEVYCFGNNFEGQLGAGSNDGFVRTPTKALGIDDAIQIAAGMYHTCALRAGGRVDCWGNDLEGRPDLKAPAELLDVPAGTTKIATGRDTTAGLANGVIWIRGEGSCWRLGFGREDDVDLPTPLVLPEPAVDVSLGEYHGCALLESGALWCWGCNGSLMVGRGGAHAAVPEQIIPGGVARVNAGYRNTCIQRISGAIECWGEKSFGMLADGKPQPKNFETTYLPVPVTALPLFSDVHLHQFHACALFEGTVRCWGQGAQGQLGDGSLANSSYPIIVIE